MVYAQLASTADFDSTPLADLVRQYGNANLNTLLQQATAAIEDYCGVRLAPFTGLTESSRAQATDIDESADIVAGPLDLTGALAQSRAQSLGAGRLVRQCWVRNRPPIRPDMWSGAISSITIERAVSGSQVIGSSQVGSAIQYEADTGHIRFYYGSFIPIGSTLLITYSGGYSSVPPALVKATCYMAARMAFVDLEPAQRPDLDLAGLDVMLAELLAPYVLEDE